MLPFNFTEVISSRKNGLKLSDEILFNCLLLKPQNSVNQSAFTTQKRLAKSYFVLGSGEMGSSPIEAFHAGKGNEAEGARFHCNSALVPKLFKYCLPTFQTSDRFGFITDTLKISFLKLNFM